MKYYLQNLLSLSGVLFNVDISALKKKKLYSRI